MRGFFWWLAKRLLFSLDAEKAHHLTLALIRLGIRMGGTPLRIVSGAGSARRDQGPVEIWGMRFRSRVGLAAGFDKNAEIVRGLPTLGFGFVEIGTVTPRPQAGNPRPRLFRDPERQALFNRMGFNSLGASIVSERLAEARPHLPDGFRVGVNIGKNKDTPLEQAADDYVRAITPFRSLCDYVVINVSSPNTPGLRSLQAVEPLKPIVEGVAGVIAGWPARPPLLLKLGPELEGTSLKEILETLGRWGIDGWVLTNTLGGQFRSSGQELAGGWSGRPVSASSERSLREARLTTKLPIVSVGGILSEADALARCEAGADLVQVYTGWIYGGPDFPGKIARNLARALKKE